jgi:hypothetical protein
MSKIGQNNGYLTLKPKCIYGISPFTREAYVQKYSRTRKSGETFKYVKTTLSIMRDCRVSRRSSSDLHFLGFFCGVGWFVTRYSTRRKLFLYILTIEGRKNRLSRNVGDKSTMRNNSEERRAHSDISSCTKKDVNSIRRYLCVTSYAVLTQCSIKIRLCNFILHRQTIYFVHTLTASHNRA